MNKLIITLLGLGAIATFTMKADNPKKIATPIVVSVATPISVGSTCPRNDVQTSTFKTVENVDVPIPLHCLEPNCGLGVYSRRENETVEKCSFCGAVKPEQG